MDQYTPISSPASETDSLEEGVALYEPIEVGIRPLIAFLAGMAIVLGLVLIVLRGQFALYVRKERAEHNIVEPARLPALRDTAASEPIIQSHPLEDMIKLRKQQLADLSSLKWVEPGKNATIPIDDAMKFLAAKGLPSRSVIGDK